MISTLLPERLLIVSPALAATIGLEEAVMLSVLHELSLHRAGADGRLRLDSAAVQQFLPFWQPQDVQRIAGNLRDQGILQLYSAPFLASGQLDLRLTGASEQAATPPVAPALAPARPVSTAVASANLIAASWQPDTELLRQLGQLGVPATFVSEQVAEFVSYWRARGEAHHAWGNRFLKQVLRNWREQQQHVARQGQMMPMNDGWRPGPDGVEILLRDGVTREFIDDAVPEFILYWRDRGDVSSTWDSKFLHHVRMQWARYTQALRHDPTPKLLSPDWQPDPDVYDILRMAMIDEAFARAQVPEFVLYWTDSRQAHNSWNSKFLHHVKYRWAKRHQQAWQGETDGFVEKHTDRSWREGL